jgi:hypothetical protein
MIAEETMRAAVAVASFQFDDPFIRRLAMRAVPVREIGNSHSGDPNSITNAIPAMHPTIVLVMRDRKFGCAFSIVGSVTTMNEIIAQTGFVSPR